MGERRSTKIVSTPRAENARARRSPSEGGAHEVKGESFPQEAACGPVSSKNARRPRAPKPTKEEIRILVALRCYARCSLKLEDKRKMAARGFLREVATQDGPIFLTTPRGDAIAEKALRIRSSDPPPDHLNQAPGFKNPGKDVAP